MAADPRFLTSRPRRRLKWEELEDGRVIVLRPRLGRGKWGLFIARRLGLSDYKIRLDDIGSLVWKACDGATPMSEIAKRLRREFGDRAEPAEDLLQQFATQMYRARMIEF